MQRRPSASAGADAAASSSRLSAARASPSACPRDERERVGSTCSGSRAEPALGVGQRARAGCYDLAPRVSASEHEDARPREQRRVHLERRVLGRRADEHDRARLDVRQERVLLRLVEAVDLVDEEDRPLPACAARASAAAITSLMSLMPASTALNDTKRALRALGDEPRDGRLARCRADPRG